MALPRLADPPPQKAADLLISGPLDSQQGGYWFRYRRSETGWRLWATPIDPSAGCGSYFATDSGPVHFRQKPGEASEDDPAQELRIRVGGNEMRENLKKFVQPAYPPEARAQHVEGTVVLKVVVDREGKVQEVQALSGPDLLVPAAVESVKQWEYRPIKVAGIPAEVETTVQVAFNSSR